ncbi:MAG: hemolysin III family protein [Candidatus Izimaplasma sp.]|nr:hemolysin III family protein [Candidatus Izimaplasma bacterium]
MRKTSTKELIANAVSHGIGLLLAISALVLLLIRSDTFLEYTGSLIYGISLIMLYLSSTLLHSFPESMRQTVNVFKRLDHSSIYLLIAGTYTPFLAIGLQNKTGIILLSILWLFAIIGIVFKSIWISRFSYLHLVLNLLMGWSVLIIFGEMLIILEGYLYLLIIGGLSYSFGVIFYLAKFKYQHFVWHIFVLMGSIFHFITIYLSLY